MGEINNRTRLAAIAVLVALLHLLFVLQLMNPKDQDKITKPPKVVEVVLLQPEPVIPKEKAAPPAPTPVQPPKPKVETPKKPPPKKIEKPKPVVKREAVAKKIAVTKPELKPIERPPVLTPPFPSVSKPVISTPPSRTVLKPIAKPGNGDAKSKGTNSGVALVSRVNPVYPTRATSRHIEGWVKIEFTVTPAGIVSSPSVVSASPPGIFDEAALAAIRKWKFKPKMIDGQAVAQRAVQTVKFTLAK